MKTFILTLFRWLGLFSLAKIITARQPRILCYHGIAVDDEYQFSPGLFMRSDTFARRMALLAKWRYKPVSLDELYRQHQAGQYCKDTLVITIDDGWAGIEQGMLPSLKKYQFVATLYLCTYFVKNQRPVFNLAASYLFWKHKGLFLPAETSCLSPYTTLQQLDLNDVLSLAAELDSAYEQPILEELASYFGEDLSSWQHNGKLMFLSPEKVTALAEQGLAIELHTHRHKFFKLTSSEMCAELNDNQQLITQLTGKKAQHFCYPSGNHRPEQLNVLREMKIKTATTTEIGLINYRTPLLTLPRLVDSDIISDLEFEAEVTGVMTLLRSVASLFKRGS
ncbi:Polysaccharide deacetylase [Arsukibacterium tuosuense]|uniref:Polysaccharide deacetylase n=1 Tax=Arsukibacterium tuosuense TaxID=1323745 RepID=A0A285IX07_9GAMM|nr:polysaccharide deacetylase family protein [Arsukibacterium tuosuense]SNY51626.1 Polysaccharide deacetylase [Arsukibacterium tuosuense]